MKRQGYLSAERRYNKIARPLIALYALLCIGGTAIWAFYDVDVRLASAGLAIVICLPIIALLAAKLRQFEETDEYTRLARLRAFARAAVIIVSSVFLVGFLEMFEVVGDVPLFLFGPLFFLAYGLVSCLQRWQGKTV